MAWKKATVVIGSLSGAILLGFVPFAQSNAYYQAGLLIFGVFLVAKSMDTIGENNENKD